MRPVVLEQESVVEAPVDLVWNRVVSAEGINHEMRPWLSMSMPKAARGRTIDELPIGVPVGRAWLLLFGIIPFDYDHLDLDSFVQGRSFHEKSTMLSMQRWEHERTLTPITGTRTAVRDRVTFVPRLPLRVMSPLLRRAVQAFFAHRHRRLTRYFG